jgi:hypothetical protein
MKKIAKLATCLLMTAAPTAAVAAPGGLSAAAVIEVVPSGEFRFEANGEEEDSADLETAYGIGAQFDYWVTEQISIGFAPRYILNIIPENEEGDSATQIDLAVRAQYNHVVDPQMTGFAFVAPGYSIVKLPEEAEGFDDPAGLVLGFGVGGRYALDEKLFLQGELGYQLGYQGTEVSFGGESIDVTFATNLLHLGVGVGSHF